MKDSTYFKYKIYRFCTVVLLVLGVLAVVSASYPEYLNKEVLNTNYKAFDTDKTSGELTQKGYANMNVNSPESRYFYTIKRVSDNRIEYHRYMPDDCIISINSEGTTKTGNCNENDFNILKEEGY